MADFKLHVEIRKATNLEVSTLRASPNPFVVVNVDQNKAYRTKSAHHTNSPVWDESADIDVPSVDSLIELNVWDDIKMFPDTSFGKVLLTKTQLEDAKKKQVNLDLPIGSGTLTISLLAITTQLKSQSIAFREQDNKRRALLIGINYNTLPEGQGKLSGCINDVKNIRNLLKKFGYKDADIRELNDDSSTPASQQPNRANILAAFDWLSTGVKSGDHLVFHFSGHGGQVNDLSGDEKDGKDECIFPADFRKAGTIIDDEIYKRLVNPLPSGSQLFAIMDCCHSGTGMDLPFEYKETGGGASSLTGVKKVVINNFSSRKKKVEHVPVGDVVLISGCKDEETSTDAVLAGKASGAMTYSLLRVLQNRTDPITYGQMLKEMLIILKQGRFAQAPQLSASVPFDFAHTNVLI